LPVDLGLLAACDLQARLELVILVAVGLADPVQQLTKQPAQMRIIDKQP